MKQKLYVVLLIFLTFTSINIIKGYDIYYYMLSILVFPLIGLLIMSLFKVKR